MVFFICAGCNETLKKNQVDKHAAKCRVCEAVSCVDCSVVFYGNDYAAHITCVSEAEKYEKSLYKGPKQKVNPQDDWVKVVLSAVNSPKAPSHLRFHLLRIGELTNVPRNAKKFANFIKNSIRLFDETIISQIWDYINTFKEPKVVAGNVTSPAVASSSDISNPTPPTSQESSIACSSNESSIEGETDRSQEKKAKKHKKEKKSKGREHESMESLEQSLPSDEVDVIVQSESSGSCIEKKMKKKKEKRALDSVADEDAGDCNEFKKDKKRKKLKEAVNT